MLLKLQNPLKEMTKTQSFAKNATDVYAKAGMIGHGGIDYRASHGTPIYAMHDGWAQYQVDTAGGHGVVIVTDKEYKDVSGGKTLFKSIYWHLVDFLKDPQYKSPIADKTGFTFVKAGDLIGYADNTGISTGSHLHIGLKPVAGEFGQWYNLLQQNGFYGAVDPAPYMQNNLEFVRWMKRGDFSEDVQKMQAFFIRTKRMNPIWFGFGTYGPLTAQAVMKYQIEKGIKHNNGVQAGPATLNALNQDYDI